MQFGEVLRNLLEQEGVSQKRLAEELLMAPSTLGNYVQGLREPDFATLKRLADRFGVTTDYLLDHHPACGAEADERLLMQLYRSFPPAQKELLLAQARLLAQYRVSRGPDPAGKQPGQP